MLAKILVVDDATFIRDMVKKQLRDHIPGVEIFDAADGVRALAVLKNTPIDVVLSDWEMPIMSGEELLKQIRSRPSGARTPFIMITSRGDRDHVVKAVQAGVSDYITKPFTADELLRKVTKQLKAIDKLPTAVVPKMSMHGIGAASVSVLTGGAKAASPRSTTSSSFNALLGNTQTNDIGAAKQPVGKAQLRFSDNRIFACVIREMSLQMMSCVMQRSEQLPTVFEQAVVDIDVGDGNDITSVNAYVHSISAGESRADSNVVKIIVRFVDNDAEKFGALSKYIAQM
jgi:DNA-binding response OmpR family regulator